MGMVNAFGLLPAHSAHLIPTLLNIYFTRTDADAISRMGRKLMSMQEPANSRKKLVRKVQEELIAFDRQHIQIHCVGVWDTVATLGIPPLDKQIPVNATMKNVLIDAQGTRQISAKKFLHVRQALALDEHRALFAPRVYTDPDIDPVDASGQSLKQRWFPGSHCDVGGSYGDNSVISQAALHWLAQEAHALQLRVNLDQLGVSPTAAQRALIHSEIYATPWWAAGGHARARGCASACEHGTNRCQHRSPEPSPEPSASTASVPARHRLAPAPVCARLAAGMQRRAAVLQRLCAGFEWLSRQPRFHAVAAQGFVRP
ncbi:MAG: DUF2235 domain-containing protein, partial [Brachymonas sp.]|nr:DUF2235 domain-containing protein [Brachymonas sp.]